MQVQIRFIARGSSAVCGSFAPGDLLRCSDDVARHLVEDCGAAVYVKPAAEPPPPPVDLVPVIQTPAEILAEVAAADRDQPAPRRVTRKG